jgi:hypothetical protein
MNSPADRRAPGRVAGRATDRAGARDSDRPAPPDYPGPRPQFPVPGRCVRAGASGLAGFLLAPDRPRTRPEAGQVGPGEAVRRPSWYRRPPPALGRAEEQNDLVGLQAPRLGLPDLAGPPDGRLVAEAQWLGHPGTIAEVKLSGSRPDWRLADPVPIRRIPPPAGAGFGQGGAPATPGPSPSFGPRRSGRFGDTGSLANTAPPPRC